MIICLTMFPTTVSRVKLYWIGLIEVMLAVCDYYQRNRDYLPNDLPEEVTTALASLDAACAALKLYDLARKRGRFQKPGPNL